MNRILSFLTVFLVFVGYSAARFSCGNDVLQSGFAELIVANDCKGRLQKMDLCCFNHRKCYEAQNKRETCDEQFCACAKNAAEKLPLCDLHANNFCNTAKNFGAANYPRPG
ncbi:unnamed protein product [Caenorhabditis auriculariae]|uniref:Phospholipase A2 n=1 Tax=Caenorhabditis auriculariae TaxID=2777116 RepID=A0A8S1HU07_9PELO|nr:unnamed protein product [Caenorhabditis auriculariae]